MPTKGALSQYFVGVAVKKLSAVEVDRDSSNQHEFNGSKALRNLLGDDRRTCDQALFLWLSGENEGLTAEGRVTWYDAREAHPTRSEYRLYFSSNEVMDRAEPDDLLLVCKRASDAICIIVAPADSTMAAQLLWLFGIEHVDQPFQFQGIGDDYDPAVDFAARYILDEIGVLVDDSDTEYLDYLLAPYLSGGFPSTVEFSALARRTLCGVSPVLDPDDALLAWLEHEERLFRRLERHLIANRIASGFAQVAANGIDVDSFISFSLSVLNRRKSRIGYALEHHLEAILIAHQVKYSRSSVTENHSKPDFLFPGTSAYHDPDFPVGRLTMLGAKSTCKDRWRQVLAEANRIREKHLLTLEPSISLNQTNEMRGKGLQLVLPRGLHATYLPAQRSWLMDVAGFIEMVGKKELSGC